MEKLHSFKADSILSHLTPATIIGCVIHSNMNLDSRNRADTLGQIFIPSFISFFVSPLFANLIYRQMQINTTVIGSYFAGIAMFIAFRNNAEIRKMTVIFPILGRIGMICGMKNSQEKIYNVIMWLIMCDVVGSVVDCFLSGEGKPNFAKKDFTDLAVNIVTVFIGRTFNLDDFVVILIILVSIVAQKGKRRLISAINTGMGDVGDVISPKKQDDAAKRRDLQLNSQPKRRSSISGQVSMLLEEEEKSSVNRTEKVGGISKKIDKDKKAGKSVTKKRLDQNAAVNKVSSVMANKREEFADLENSPTKSKEKESEQPKEVEESKVTSSIITEKKKRGRKPKSQ
jgi:hypothetical protein